MFEICTSDFLVLFMSIKVVFKETTEYLNNNVIYDTFEQQIV